jgi:peptidoglycan/LPS O-acetylase OafA/YrhL
MYLLRRITSSGRFIPEIDGFRFLAIALVFMYHFNGLYPGQGGRLFTAIAQRGSYGVQLFFAISGFILGLPFAAHYLTGKDPVNLRRYFLRRLTRLEPPYALNILTIFVFALFVSGKLSLAKDSGHFLASLFYVHSAIYGRESLVNTVAWSLEVEVQFYCVAPLLAKVFALRHRRLVLVCVMLAIGGLQAFMPHPPIRLTLSLVWQLQYFLGGFVLADLYLTVWKEMPLKSWHWDIIGLLAFILLFSSTLTRGTATLVLPFFTLLFYSAIFQSRFVGAGFRWWPITSLGGMCYTIYLYHDSIIDVLARHIGRHYFVTNFAILSVAVIGFSLVHFLLIEKPCMKADWYKFRSFRANKSIVVKDEVSV